jgi:hypothetical protein
MIAKPLIPFSNMMREETSNVATTRRSLFNPVNNKKESTITITRFTERSRTSSFEKPVVSKSNTKKSTRRSKHISFSKQLEQVVAAPESHSDANVNDLWLSHFDFQRFLKSAQQEAKTIRISDDEDYLIGMDQSHSIAIQLAESVNKNFKDETLLNRISTRLDMKNTGLANWCLETPHRGLERIASKQLRHSKHYVRREIKALVLSAKGDNDDAISVASCGSASTTGTGRTEGGSKKQLTPEMLAQRYEQRTKESRLFARMMGLADELAAQRAYDEEEEEE